MKHIRIGCVLLMLGLCAVAQAAAPKVVKATPDDGQEDVDPKTTEIRIVFDQPMDRRGGWSIVGGGESFPQMIGRPRWIDEKTFVIRVKLKPGHEYWLSINNENFTNFRNVAGESAVPYPISFKTAGDAADAGDAAKVTADDHRQAVQILREAIDENYSHRDLHGLDWAKLFETYGPKLEAALSPQDFAQIAAKLLGENRDIHMWLKVNTRTIGTTQAKYTRNYNYDLLRRKLALTSHDNLVLTAKLEGGIDYLMITAWDADRERAMEAAYEVLAGAKKLIIDVRPNGGGDELMAQRFAGCFIDAPKVYSKNTIRMGGKFHGPFERTVEPNKARPPFRGPVVVLMGPGNMSSCESFLLMMRQNPNCTLIGATSYGSSGNPKPVELGNGVVAFIPSWQDMLPDGTMLEGKGVKPDVEVATTPAQLEETDPVLEEALKRLRAPAR